MCGPEEDLVQGGRFLMEPERFINFFNSGPLIHIPQGTQKKVIGESAKKSGRPSAYITAKKAWFF